MATDTQLLARWQDGDKKSGAELFDRHYAAVARFFANKAGNDAQDLAQKTFLACVGATANFEGRSSFRSFLFGIAHNVLREHYRARARANAREMPLETSIHDLAPGLNTLYGRRQNEQRLLLALRMLPMDTQVLLELYFWEDMTARELANSTGVPEGTIRTRIRDARIKLGKILEQLPSASAARGGPDDGADEGERVDAWVRSTRAQMPRDDL